MDRPAGVSGTGFASPGIMRAILPIVCLLAVTACESESPLAPGFPLDAEFTLAVGASASIDGTSLRLEFREVTGDSRCPANVFCIQGGDALVHVRASAGGQAASLELHTGDSSRASVTYQQFRITLVALQPYPFGTGPIRQDEYRATFTVTRN